MPNHLANEASPYLRQHADNPVDWYPWGEEALRLAREQDKPILLSIGYASCHWCHVMAHESFENEAIASLMNEHFINIKVDREERPDLDSIYMTAAQVMTGHGGWPLTIFLTPDGLPFYAGTYFPPEDRQVGSSVMPGLPRVLLAVAEAYRTRRNEVEQGGEQIREILERHYARSMPDSALTPTVLDDAVRRLVEQFDRVNGGFGGAPKFPSPMPLELLLRTYRRIDSQRALDMVRMTLVHMAFGGIYDQVGGGFHRYTVDAGWLVPHFEKMLYDNAQLARLYTLAWQVTGSSLYERIALETFAYVLREMTSPEGGFYASQDADSEGEEGKFYLWTPEEIRAALPPREAAMVERFFGVEPGGNFEGKTILSVPRDPAIVAEELGVPLEELVTTVAQARDALYAARARRVWPGCDEKVLTAWNGLMLRALAEGAAAFDRADLRDAAIRNARFIREALYVDGHLMRSWTAGRARVPGFLEDYADVIDGLIALYELTFDVQWIRWARELAATMIAEFWDDERGGFFDTPVSPEQLITRPKELAETATPSGNSVAADAFLRLAALTGDEDLRRRAVAIVAANGPVAAEQPIAYGRLLAAYDLALAPQSEIALVGDPDSPDTAALLRAVRSAYLPWKVVALKRPGDETSEADVPLLAGRVTQDGRATAYVCRHFTCRLPVIEPADLMRELELVAADAAS